MADDSITDGDATPDGSSQGRKTQDPDNAVAQSRRRAREIQTPRSAPPQSGERGQEHKGPANDRRPGAVPEHITKRFVKVDQRYYFPDGAHAFTDRGSRLTTKSENTEVVKSLIEIAEARGWEQITVSGTERFRREAWAAATAAGLSVRGYVPTEIDRAYVARQRARDAAAAEVPTDTAPSTPTRDGAQRADRSSGVIRGRLLDYGAAPYRHDPHEGMSYFVRVETAEGPREVWGVDLERALAKSLTRPQRGDEVGLRAVRREQVTVQTAKRDPEGKVVGQTPLDVHRNQWIVERGDFFDAREAAAQTLRDPSVDARQGARQHPELIGSYLQMHAAEIASRQFQDPEDRIKFVNRVRAALAEDVARGEALPPVRLKERAAAQLPPEREEAPAR